MIVTFYSDTFRNTSQFDSMQPTNECYIVYVDAKFLLSVEHLKHYSFEHLKSRAALSWDKTPTTITITWSGN